MLGNRSLFAGVDIIDSHTLLAADVAAPVENTVALLLSLFGPGVVTPATAEEVTAIYAVGRQVAGAVAGAKGAGLRVRVTEVGRVLVVNQVAVCGRLEVVVLGPQGLHPATGLLVLLHHHLRGAVVLVFHVVPNDPEVGQRPPTGLHLTAARKAVALALQEHFVVEGLERERQETG